MALADVRNLTQRQKGIKSYKGEHSAPTITSFASLTEVVPGAKLVAAPLGHGRACPGHPDNRALCHPDRDRRDKPGEDATSFAPVAGNFSKILIYNINIRFQK
jgi:hypothetical protein